jgi:hypothetical protein
MAWKKKTKVKGVPSYKVPSTKLKGLSSKVKRPSVAIKSFSSAVRKQSLRP